MRPQRRPAAGSDGTGSPVRSRRRHGRSADVLALKSTTSPSPRSIWSPRHSRTLFVDPNPYKEQFGVEGRLVAAHVRVALAEQGNRTHAPGGAGDHQIVPQLRLHRVGCDTPGLDSRAGQRYQLNLERLAWNLGISKHVIFYNRFVELKELTEFIRAADVAWRRT